MAAYTSISPPSQGMLLASSLPRAAQPMRIPSRGHGAQPAVPRVSGSLLEQAPSTSLASYSAASGLHEATSYMSRYVSLSASGRQRRPSVASSPTVPEEGSSEKVSVVPVVAGFSPRAVTVGFDTASTRVSSLEAVGAGQRNSPFRQGPPPAVPASSKPPVPPAAGSGKQGLLSKALSLSEMQQGGFHPPKVGFRALSRG